MSKAFNLIEEKLLSKLKMRRMFGTWKETTSSEFNNAKNIIIQRIIINRATRRAFQSMENEYQ
jgi:hypothetical protein